MNQTEKKFNLDDVLTAGWRLANINSNLGHLSSELLRLSQLHDRYLKSEELRRLIESAERYKKEAEDVAKPHQDSAMAQDYLKYIYQRADKILEEARFEDYWVYRRS